MSIDQQINNKLNSHPKIKKIIKRLYQVAAYTLSHKIKSEGQITIVSPDDEYEYFFGYYDKSPWDITDRYMLCLKAKNTWKDVSPKEPADLILIDTKNENRVTHLATTHSWNVQQGCMAQWLGPDCKNRIIYNDFRDGKYCSIILKLKYSKNTITATEEKIFPMPVYAVSQNGDFALSLDFSRLYNLRPGYGYYNAPETTQDEKLPDQPCIWRMDLRSGKTAPILKYTDFANFKPRKEMKDEKAIHKVNHIMISPNGKRFMVLYHWFVGQKKYTRLITCDTDGRDMYLLSDDDMVSHCFWKNDNEILAFENKRDTGPGYYLMRDKSPEYQHLWKSLSGDGHPSYSPDGRYTVTDSYPDRARVQDIKIMTEAPERVETVAKVLAPFRYDNDTRCDLHPRWNHAGDAICFDAAFTGKRTLSIVRLEK